jgi:hypothetical protein
MGRDQIARNKQAHHELYFRLSPRTFLLSIAPVAVLAGKTCTLAVAEYEMSL